MLFVGQVVPILADLTVSLVVVSNAVGQIELRAFILHVEPKSIDITHRATVLNERIVDGTQINWQVLDALIHGNIISVGALQAVVDQLRLVDLAVGNVSLVAKKVLHIISVDAGVARQGVVQIVAWKILFAIRNNGQTSQPVCGRLVIINASLTGFCSERITDTVVNGVFP